jgi:hypothetical protein
MPALVARTDYLERAAERDAGNCSGVPVDPIVVPLELTAEGLRRRAIQSWNYMIA